MNIFWYKLPVILYSILIFVLSSFPLNDFPSVPVAEFDKLIHFIEYAIFGIFLMLAFTNMRSVKVVRSAIMISLIVGICYAGTDEIHQWFVPGRNSSIFDLIADAAGVVIGVILYNRIKFIRSSKQL